MSTDGVGGITGDQGLIGNVTISMNSSNDLNADTDAGLAGETLSSLDTTGGVATSSEATVVVQTGDASAGVSLSTDVNSNEVQSGLGTSTLLVDFDTYVLTASRTNDAVVMNSAIVAALTGDNIAESANEVVIGTGNVLAVANIANVVNTNVINSNGFMSLLNQVIDSMSSWNLQDLFFPGGAASVPDAHICTLMSCAAEDVTYTISNTNTGEVTNMVNLDAVSGQNIGVGDVVVIDTGDAYAAANVITIANSNIIDSNYRLLTVNGIGTLNGDLVLPTGALFKAFYGLSNGMNQVEDETDVKITDVNVNNASIDNALATYAESGLNDVITTVHGATKTGTSSAHSNVVNEVNKNLFGGDSLYLLIRVHGAWNGNVFGLPEGLSWVESAEGIVIYNTDAEIVPSEILNYDVDTYKADFSNNNTIAINNDLNINAVTGKNNLDASLGTVNTGDAYAGANVMNIANTNVIGRNWIMAIMNIFGDFNGNVSFGQPDLWVGGEVQSMATPVGPGAKVVYTFTVKNNGDLTATDVTLHNELLGARITYRGGAGEQREARTRDELIGTLLPGETKLVSFDAYVDDTLPVGITPVLVKAGLALRESDRNQVNNHELVTLNAEYALPVVIGGSSGGSSGGGSNSSTSGNSSSGGGGGSNRASSGKLLSKTAVVSKVKVDKKAPPKISVTKTANVKSTEIVKAGQEVIYVVVVTNDGGIAYDAKVSDQLLNPIGSVVSEQSWDLGTIGAGEKINLTYTVSYASTTPSGVYTNTARVTANRLLANGTKSPLSIKSAVYTVMMSGQAQSVGNVGITMFAPIGTSQSAAILAWETIQPTDGQVFFGPAGTGTSSPYSPYLANYGYAQASYRSPLLTTKHFIVLTGLRDGVAYNYRLRSVNETGEIISTQYSFVVPTDASLALQLH